MAGHGVPAVDAFGELLTEMLERARATKKTDTVEPPLNKADLVDLFEQLDSIFPPSSSPEVKKRSQYAVIETAVRLKFNDLLVSLAQFDRETMHLTIHRPLPALIHQPLLNCGICSTSYPYYPTTNNATRPFFFGSSRSSWTAKLFRDAGRCLITWSPGAKGLRRNTSAKRTWPS